MKNGHPTLEEAILNINSLSGGAPNAYLRRLLVIAGRENVDKPTLAGRIEAATEGRLKTAEVLARLEQIRPFKPLDRRMVRDRRTETGGRLIHKPA